MAPLEPWEKVLVDGELFPQEVHGHVACVDCHAGQNTPDKFEAHLGLIENPSKDPVAACGDCHPDVVATHDNSLHSNLAGYWTVLEARTVPEDHEAIATMFGNHCSSCHATCGECHVSQPNLVGGGLIKGHLFSGTPSMTRNCTACHGSRVGNEYLGKHEGLRPDVHFSKGRMTCVACHSGHQMHGAPDNCQSCHNGPEAQLAVLEAPPNHRYDGVQAPRCETCHMTVAMQADDIEMHQQHGGNLSCQVCHSISYTSCDGCHVAISETTGNPFYATDDHYFTFIIGKNVLQSYDRPYQYVTVRHIPVARDSYSFYGDNLLPNFDALPTWAYTTPHNIQRNTPQTESCDACHGNAALFLTVDKVYPDELQANLPVIVERVPPPIAEITSTLTITTSTSITTTTVITPTTQSP